MHVSLLGLAKPGLRTVQILRGEFDGRTFNRSGQLNCSTYPPISVSQMELDRRFPLKGGSGTRL